jgi:hypothetical protein
LGVDRAHANATGGEVDGEQAPADPRRRESVPPIAPFKFTEATQPPRVDEEQAATLIAQNESRSIGREAPAEEMSKEVEAPTFRRKRGRIEADKGCRARAARVVNAEKRLVTGTGQR